MENVRVLCVSCHVELHRRARPRTPEREAWDILVNEQINTRRCCFIIAQKSSHPHHPGQLFQLIDLEEMMFDDMCSGTTFITSLPPIRSTRDDVRH